jgi:tetratricopeptide (TPR) repeat protein
VALKIIKPGMDTRQVIARFEAERQALAMMDHPNIAKVFDAGATENGRPYFVMELVQGVPITEYCDQCNLTTRERLELFITVCHAVQHAHQKGIIHRDIKPTNVLVAMQDGQPTPKIIDFGVAKAIDQHLTERTLTNAFAQMVGSPLYMSPEQAELSALGVDTRSDIYSLGVLLYELLAGTTPFDKERLYAAPYDEMRRIIREEEPPRPSARLNSLSNNSLPLGGRVGEGVSAAETAALTTTIAAHRRTDARRLSQQVRGELDWIVMKCLEKDRNRRYETPSSLARDIERYLHDEPVQACPPSASYRFRKFARRNKTLLAAVGAVASTLVVGIGLSTWMYFRERAAVQVAKANEQRAAAESARAQAVSDYLLQMIFSPSRGWRIKGSQYTVREMLDDYAAGLGNHLADQPEADALIRHAIGCSYLMLGAPDRAEPYLHRAIELRRTLRNPQTKILADSLANYGRNLFLQRRYDEAESSLREALEIYHQLGIRGTMPISVCEDLRQALAAAGRHGDAERAIQQAWAEMQGYDQLPPESAQFPYSDVSATCAGFAYYFATIGREKEAAEFLRRATLAQERLRKPIDSLGALQFVAATRLRLGDQAGYREACAKMAVPPPHGADDASQYIVYDEFNLARIWTCCLGPDAVDDPTDIVKQAEEFAAHNSLQAPYIDFTLLGAAHFRAGHFERAAQCLEQSIAQYPSDPPTQHGTVLWPQLYLAMTKWQQGRHDDARRMLREIQPAIDKSLDTPVILWQYRQITDVLRREAEAMIEPEQADEAVENDNRPPSTPANSNHSSWEIPGQSGYAVEVRVTAGDICQTICLHYRHDQRIVRQKAVLDAERGGGRDQTGRDRQQVNPELRHFLNRLAETAQLLDSGRVLLQSVDHFRRPAELLPSFGRHQSVGDFAEHVGRREGRDLVSTDSFDQFRARRSKHREWNEVIDQRIRIQEYAVTGVQVVERHYKYSVSSASLRIRSNVSASPVQPIIPAVCSARLGPCCTVTLTFSWSASGNGRSNLSIPFS